ncbi:MAG: tripartite tricarboxylate transporter permease [Rhodocyclaceae bacterium]
MDLFSNIMLGLQTALSPTTLMFCFIGVTVGTFVGVLPGVGALAAISLALPMTYYPSHSTQLFRHKQLARWAPE